MTDQLPNEREPEELAHLLDFCNTVDVEAGTELLRSARALVGFLADRELVSPSARAPAADLDSALELRAAVRGVLEARREGAPEGTALDRLAMRMPLRATAGAGERPLAPVQGGVSGGLASLLADLATGRITGSWDRLKMCAERSCSWVFHDASRNRSRRWCSMEVCGNRAKTRAYRERRRGAA